MARRICRAGFGLLVAFCCCQCSRESAEPGANPATQPATSPVVTEPLLPLPAPPDISIEKIELGKRLFHDTALSSAARKISCATCHPLERGGTVGMLPAGSVAGETEPCDIPTVYNSADQFAYFWNGRAQSLEAVVQTSVRSENVMDGSWEEIIRKLSEIPDYMERFSRAYPETGLAESAIEDALASFVRSLSTPNAPFDRWLGGGDLPAEAKDGYTLFKSLGCVRCHQGAGAGGNLYASFGSYIAGRDKITNNDLGRFNVTRDEAHRYQFKVPSLRNVALTAPYFHDGSAATLADAVRAMALHQSGRVLDEGEVKSITAFLESLTGTTVQEGPAGSTP